MELFAHYDECVKEDEDGNTVFEIYKFYNQRPANYEKFYRTFF